jgi:hypothetical protein
MLTLRGRGVVPNHKAPQSRGPNSYRSFPGAIQRCTRHNHLSRWCRLRILHEPRVAGSIPARDAIPVAQWQSNGKFRNRSFPG